MSDVFTDWAYVRYDSMYASVEAALCISSCIITEKGTKNSLRNYSYLANSNELKLLKNNELLEIIIGDKSPPFVLSISFNCKKHTTYKSFVNYNNNVFTITTDLFSVEVDLSIVDKFLPIIQKWYTLNGKNTFFTKNEILTGYCPINKILDYGLEDFESENKILERYRNTNLFNLFIHIIQKQ